MDVGRGEELFPGGRAENSVDFFHCCYGLGATGACPGESSSMEGERSKLRVVQNCFETTHESFA
jgi:hypothetical protein